MKQFKTIGELMSDEFFNKAINSNISTLLSNRNNRKSAPEGMKYKRDWYDRLQSEGNSNHKFFIENIEQVASKNNNLPSEIRKVINYVFEKSLTETFQHYNNVKSA